MAVLLVFVPFGAAAPTVALVGGERTRAVQLAPCLKAMPTALQGLGTPACLPGAAGWLSGSLTVAFVNDGTAHLDLRTRYIQAGASVLVGVYGGGPVTLLGASADGLHQRADILAKHPASVSDVLGLLGGGTSRDVARVAVRLTREVVARGLRSLRPPQVRTLIAALSRVVRPAGGHLMLDRRSVQGLLVDVSSIVGSHTRELRQRRLERLVADVLDVLGTTASVNIGARKTSVVALRFDLPNTTDPAGAGGFLELDLSGKGRHAQFDVPVELALRPLTGIKFEPSTVELQQTWPLRADEKSVDLRGPGVSLLFASGRPANVNVNLGGPSANHIRVSLTNLKQISGDRATGSVSLRGGPAPGSYTTAIPLSRSQDDSPQLNVIVHSSLSRLFAFALILLGLGLGGYAPQIYALRRRRRLLREALTDAVANYSLHYQPDQPASWDLKELLQPEANPDGSIVCKGVEPISADIESARNNADLDDDTTRVLDVVARVQRWLRLEPAARRLQDLVAHDPVNHVQGLDWVTTRTYLDSLAVLRALKREPPDAAAADELAAQVLWQIDWYHRFSGAWDSVRPNSAIKADELKAVDEALAKTGTLERTAAQRDELAANLDVIYRRTEIAAEPLPVSHAELNESIMPEWDVAPFHFTGWATLDGLAYDRVARHARRLRLVAPSYTRLADAAPTPASTIAVKPTNIDPVPAGGATRHGRRFNWADLLWSLLLVAGAALAYMVTIYSDTWGSLENLLTAAAAGFGTAVAVQWAALPAFQSLRLRASPSAAAASGSSAAKKAK